MDEGIGRGAVLYDFLQVRGGAEKVTLTLARGLSAEVCIVFRNRGAFPDKDVADLNIRELGVPADFAVWRTLKGMSDFRGRTDFLAKAYDWVIYSGSNSPQAVFNQHAGKRVCYCHTIPRFAYDLIDHYRNAMPSWQRQAFEALVRHVRPRYEAAMAEMDLILTNSENVRQRIETYLGLDAKVIYPPVDVSRCQWLQDGDFYLSTARVEPYKRVCRIVEAFRNIPHKQLVVASGGSDLERVKAIANGASNIRFTGWVSDCELQDLVGRCVATIYLPLDEDFGMSPVESMAAGKPVIGVAEGGLLETVVDGKTGILLEPDPTPEAIQVAVEKLDGKCAAAMRPACEAQAKRFDESLFINGIRDHLGPDHAATACQR